MKMTPLCLNTQLLGSIKRDAAHAWSKLTDQKLAFLCQKYRQSSHGKVEFNDCLYSDKTPGENEDLAPTVPTKAKTGQ